MMQENTVYIVDDDAAVRDSLGLLLSLHGYRTAFFADAKAFLGVWSEQITGCAIIDIRMPGMDGLALQKILREKGCRLPVLIATGHGDVESARSAFRAQAVDFLEKPLREQQLIAAIEEAFAQQSATRKSGPHSDYLKRLAGLTPREREVMLLLVAGRHNREMPAAL